MPSTQCISINKGRTVIGSLEIKIMQCNATCVCIFLQVCSIPITNKKERDDRDVKDSHTVLGEIHKAIRHSM